MPKSSTSFNSGNQPKERKGRGKSERTKILDSFGRCSKTEEEFYDLLTTKAFNPEDNFSFKELLSRLSPISKSTFPCVTFEFNKKSLPHEQASQVLDAIAQGIIPSDIGNSFVSSIQSMLKIKEVTDLEERLKAMEDHIESSE